MFRIIEIFFDSTLRYEVGASMIGLLATLYMFVALFATYKTYCEQQHLPDITLLAKVTGFLACALWPITLLAATTAFYIHKYKHAT